MMFVKPVNKCANAKVSITIIIILILINVYTHFIYKDYIPLEVERLKIYDFDRGRWRNLSEDQINSLSNLGRILFLGEDPPPIKTLSAPYKILIWKYGPQLAKRHIRDKSNPLQQCSIQNCVISYNDTDIDKADLVLFHLHRIESVKQIPARTAGNKQIWAFLTDESPFNTFLSRKNNTIGSYNNIFNWSMSYRMASDIPVPYGRTVPLETKTNKIDIVEWNQSKKQDVLVAIMISNCNKKRMSYISELRKHIQVDVYGGCGTLKCPGHFYKDCANISDYKFYLAFENSYCDEYITEKVWWNGYAKNSIPIVMGGSKLSLQQSLPPKSFIDVNDFASPSQLAMYLMYLNNTLGELESFFEWKRSFEVLNEHGYFHSLSVHYCRICEALNYNSKQDKIYSNIKDYFTLDVCR